MNNFETLPAGYILCPWCDYAVKEAETCSHCRLALVVSPIAVKAPEKPSKAPKREKVTRDSGKSFIPANGRTRLLGIDPGARYTGIVVRDMDMPIYSGIFVRPVEMSATDWALECIKLSKEVYESYNPDHIAIEGISDPKGFYKGQQAAINPKDIIRTGIVVGALVATWPHAIIVAPGGNGDRDETFYPSSMNGRRPKDLDGSNNGAGTRKHEKSAYDVAGKALKQLGVL